MTTNTYVTTASVMELRNRLTTDDWAVLHDVQQMRVAGALDLQALAELRSSVGVRTFRRRLQRLHDTGVLDRLERRVGGMAAGSAGWVYALGIAGQRLLNSQADGSTSARRPWTPRPSWLRHALAVSHLYVVLRTAEHEGQLRLLAYQPEPQCWRPFTDGEGQTVLKPDAFVLFEVGDEIVSIFIEVDCATESPATLRTKQAVYWRHYLTDDEQTAHGVYPEVLWLAPSAPRCRVIEKVIAGLKPDAQRLHRVATYEHALGALLEPP